MRKADPKLSLDRIFDDLDEAWNILLRELLRELVFVFLLPASKRARAAGVSDAFLSNVVTVPADLAERELIAERELPTDWSS